MASAIDAKVLDEAFDSFRKEIETEQTLREEIREVVRRLEQEVREAQKVFQKIHHSDVNNSTVEAYRTKMKEICASARKIFESIKGIYKELAVLIPPNEFYKYHDHHRYPSQKSRLCPNAVSRGDMGLPFRISAFMCDLDAGFRLLNLKNDSLRKRFDALKYDVRRVEEVVYDITVRDLKPKYSEREEKC